MTLRMGRGVWSKLEENVNQLIRKGTEAPRLDLLLSFIALGGRLLGVEVRSPFRGDRESRGEGLELLLRDSKEGGVPLQMKEHEVEVLGGGDLKDTPEDTPDLRLRKIACTHA